MKQYRSHKIVEAGKITAIEVDEDKTARIALDTGEVITTRSGWYHQQTSRIDGDALIGGYYVRYSDGYDSWSPAGVFEDGYTEHTPAT